MICPICQNETNDASKFCIKCGAEIPRCPECNQLLRKRMRFCVSCGLKLPESTLRAFGTSEAQDNPSPVVPSVNEKPVEVSTSAKPEASQEVLHQINPGTTLPESDEAKESKPPAATMPPMSPTPVPESGNPPTIEQATVKRQKKVRYCLQCGNPCDSDQPICRSCQIRMLELNQQNQTTVSSVDELPAEKSARKKKVVGRIILVVFIVVLLLALAGGGFFFAMRFMQDKKNNEKSPNEVTVIEQTPETSELPEEPAGEPESMENPEPTEPEKTTAEPAEAIEEPEPVPAETSGVEDTNDTVYSQASNDKIGNIKASSVLVEEQYGVTHSANRVCDGDLSTAWSEGVPGLGIGEGLLIEFIEPCLITGIHIWAGYQKSESSYYNNCRPSSLRIVFPDGTSEVFELNDTMGEQTIALSEERLVDSITMVIEGVYNGAKHEDTVISEIKVY